MQCCSFGLPYSSNITMWIYNYIYGNDTKGQFNSGCIFKYLIFYLQQINCSNTLLNIYVFCTKYFQTHFLIRSKCTKIETKWHTLVQTDLMASKQMRILVVSRYYLYPLLFLFLETIWNTFGWSFPLFFLLKFCDNCCLSILKTIQREVEAWLLKPQVLVITITGQIFVS